MKPTKQQVLDSRTSVLRALSIVRASLAGDRASHDAFTEVETFCAVAMRVMSKTNMSKLRSETTNVELAARLSGRIVLDPD